MTNRGDQLEISRRSMLGFLGAAAAERVLAQHPLFSTMKDGASGALTPNQGLESNPTITIDSTHNVRYSSGGLSYVENLHQGRWVGSSLSAGGKSQELSEPDAQDAFTIFVKDKPDSGQARGTLLSGDWEWVAASDVPHQIPQKRHGIVKLSYSKLPLTLEIHTLLDRTPIFTRWLTLTNESKSSLALMELSPWSGRLWSGRPAVALGASQRWEYLWEGWFGWKALEEGTNLVKEDRGLSFDDPYFVLRNEDAGQYAFGQLAWPANYLMEFRKEEGIAFRVGPTAAGALRVIGPGEMVTTPAMHLGAVIGDFDNVVQAMHDHIRRSVLPVRDPARSHLIEYLIPEDWPMTVYRGDEYNEANMKKCIDVLAAVGFEVFILDGPMWCSAYGNWSVPNKTRFPQGLGPLIDYAHSKGILFGLYSETEGGRDGYCSNPRFPWELPAGGACIGKWDQSSVFQEHPEWFAAPSACCAGRILNLAIPEAAAYLKSTVNGIIDQYRIDLFRHDFNAPQQGHGSQTPRDGFVEDDYWRHYDAFYEIFRAVHREYPKVILQQASAGGARFDVETAGVFQEQNTSDRAGMPYVYKMLSGLSVFLPPEILVNPNGLANQQDLPDLDTTLRGAFALGNTPMIYNAMLPKNIETLTPAVREKYLHYVTLYKEFIRPLLSVCKVYHHAPVNGDGGVDSGDWFAMEFVAPEREKGWSTIIRLAGDATTPYLFKPRGLDAGRKYRVKFDSSGREGVHQASELAEQGLLIRLAEGSASELLLIERAS